MITIFERILGMSILGCYSILVVGLVRQLLKRYGRKYTYWLWFVVFVNLCVPMYVQAPFSLVPQRLSEVANVSVQDSTVDSGAEKLPTEYTTAAVNGEGQEKVVPVAPAEVVKEYPGVITEPDTYEETGEARYNPENSSNAELAESSYGEKIKERNVFAATTGKEVCCALWIFGMAGLFLWNLLHMLRFRRKLMSAKRIYVDKEQGILQVDGITTPFLYGIVKPVIYLSADLAEDEKDYIIAHEKYHRARRDYLVKPIVFCIVLLHWFNPLVWLAYFLFIRDMEFSCDEAVLADAETGVRKQYAGSLLKCAARQNGYVLTMLTFGEPTVKSRIQNILQYKKRSVAVSGLVVACVAAVSVGLFVRQEQSVSEEEIPLVEAISEGAGANGMEEKGETDTAFTWEYGEIVPEVGRTTYVDRLLSSDMVYAGNAGEIAYITFADEAAAVAYVLADTKPEEGISGSLWKVPLNGDVTLLKQQIVIGDENPQYVTVDGVRYLVLNYWENGQFYGKLLPFAEENEELFPHLSGGKVIGDKGSIQCLTSSYRSCEAIMQENTGGETTFLWTAGKYLPYDFTYMGDGKIRAVSAGEISEEELKTLPYGAKLKEQVEEEYPEGSAQYILRENGRLDVNIFTKSEKRADFYYMSFLVDEPGATAVLQESGEGVYLVSMTGNPALEAFLQALDGEERQLPTEITQLPWGEEEAFTREWSNSNLGEREQSYIYGTEYELTEAEQQIMQGLLLDCSENWDARPSYTESNTNADWNEANKKIYVIQKTEGFVAYSRYFESGMLVWTPDGRYVLIDGYFTSNYGVQPEVLELDFDGDGSRELAIIGLTEHGTGVCVDYLYMVDKDADGKWYAYRVKHDWYEEKLRGHIDSSEYSAGSQIDFYFEGEKIICEADLMIYSDTPFMGLYDGSQLYMELTYLGGGRWAEGGCEYGVDEAVRKQTEE